jgi:predicted RecA/RadA family phage recombinase
MRSREKILIIHPADNVGVALFTIREGESVNAGEAVIRASDEIPRGFKIALNDIRKGEPVVKYGEIIGLALADIFRGGQVHVHNCESQRGRGDRK